MNLFWGFDSVVESIAVVVVAAAASLRALIPETSRCYRVAIPAATIFFKQ